MKHIQYELVFIKQKLEALKADLEADDKEHYFIKSIDNMIIMVNSYLEELIRDKLTDEMLEDAPKTGEC